MSLKLLKLKSYAKLSQKVQEPCPLSYLFFIIFYKRKLFIFCPSLASLLHYYSKPTSCTLVDEVVKVPINQTVLQTPL